MTSNPTASETEPPVIIVLHGWFILLSCLIIWPLGMLLTFVPVFWQDPTNSNTFTTVVLRTAFFAGVIFPLVLVVYRKFKPYPSTGSVFIVGAIFAAVIYILLFYGLGLLLPIIRGLMGATLQQLAKLDDQTLWFYTIVTWLLTHLVTCRQMSRLQIVPGSPTKVVMVSRPKQQQVPKILRFFVIGVVLVVLISLLFLVWNFR